MRATAILNLDSLGPRYFGEFLNSDLHQLVQEVVLDSIGCQINLNQMVQVIPLVDQLEGEPRIWGGPNPILVPAGEIFVARYDLWGALKKRVTESNLLRLFPLPNRVEIHYEINYYEEKASYEIWEGD